MKRKIISDPVVSFFVIVIGIVIIALVLKELSHIFLPFIIAYFLFFLFSPLNEFLHSKKIPLFLIAIIDITITALLAWGISAFLIDSFLRFGEQFPEYSDKLNVIVRDASVSLGIKDPYFRYFSVQKIISKLDYKLLAGGIAVETFSLVGSILFVLLFFVFVLSGHNTMYESIKRRFIDKKVQPEIKAIKKKYHTQEIVPLENEPEIEVKIDHEIHEKEEKLIFTFKEITGQIQRYIIAKIGVNSFAGILTSVALLIFGIDFPIIWGLFVFLFNFIPSIGSAIALLLPTVMTLIQTGSISYALLIAGVLAVIQTLFFNILEPMVIGKRLNLNPLLILFSVLIWGYIWGIVGMLLSVPLTAIIKIVIANSPSQNMQFINHLMSSDINTE